MTTFNPRRKTETTSGPGRIKLDDSEEQTKAEQKAAAKKPKWLVPAAVGGIAAAGLAGYFMFSSGPDNTVVTPPPAPPPIVTPQPQTPPALPPVATPLPPQVPGAAAIRADSIAEKMDSIYTDRANAMYDAYITAGGREARAGDDFAIHVGLFKQGGISVLVTEGPHAGTRIGFMPFFAGSEGRLRVTYERIGQITMGPDGRTRQFVPLPPEQQIRRETVLSASNEMRFARQQGFPGSAIRSSVSLPGSAREFEKQVVEKGEWHPAFWLHGSPERDGLFTVEIWNGDTYAMNLDTGAFTVNSVYLFEPDIDRKIEIAFDPGHPQYRALRMQRNCDLNPRSSIWEDCKVTVRGKDFPNAVNGKVPGVTPPALRPETPRP